MQSSDDLPLAARRLNIDCFYTFIDLFANTLLTVRKLLHHLIITASLDVVVVKDLRIARIGISLCVA